MHKNTLLRTPETWEKYRNRRATLPSNLCFLCKPHTAEVVIVKEFTHFIIVENQYPYDAVAEVHHLLAPKTHVRTLLAPHRYEYETKVLPYLKDAYDFIGENTPRNQTQPEHHHIHLLTWRRV